MDYQLNRLVALAAQHQRTLWTLACAAVLVPFSVFIMLTHIYGSDFMGMGSRSAQAMLEGTALKPQVYRQLVPVLTRAVIAITPAALQESLTTELHAVLWDSSPLRDAARVRHRNFVPPELNDDHLYPLFIIILFDYAFLLGYLYLLWRLAQRLFPELFSTHILAPFLGAIAIPVFSGKYGYMYDFPVLFFSAWMTWILLQKRLYMFTFFLVLATINKESAIYFVILFALYGYRELPRRSLVFFIMLQILLFALVKLMLAWNYSLLPPNRFEGYSLMTHIRYALDGYSIYTLLGIGAAIAMFGYRWHEKPFILRCWMAILPLMILACLFYGNRAEYRVFYEIFPCLTLLAAHSFSTGLRWEKQDA